jgi:hypothetical protein
MNAEGALAMIVEINTGGTPNPVDKKDACARLREMMAHIQKIPPRSISQRQRSAVQDALDGSIKNLLGGQTSCIATLMSMPRYQATCRILDKAVDWREVAPVVKGDLEAADCAFVDPGAVAQARARMWTA